MAEELTIPVATLRTVANLELALRVSRIRQGNSQTNLLFVIVFLFVFLLHELEHITPQIVFGHWLPYSERLSSLI